METTYTIRVEAPRDSLRLITLLQAKGFSVFRFNKWENNYEPIDKPTIAVNGTYTCIYNGHTAPPQYIMKKIEEDEHISYTIERRVE